MTATMALKYTASAMDIQTSLKPSWTPCHLQRAQDQLLHLHRGRYGSTGETRIIEHGNPPFLLVRPGAS